MASHFAAVFGERQVIRAYFSCAQFDAVTPYFLRRLQKDARIFLYDHYHMPEVREKRWIPRLAAKWLILRFVTGVSFGFCKETLDSGSDTIWRTTFDAGLLNAREIVISPKWSCLPLPPISAPFVIIMDSNDEPSPFGYADLMGDLIANLRSRNINIVLKAHPRSGCSPFLSKFNLPELPAGCPIELFDIHDVAAVIGITSLGLAAVAQLGHTAVSLLYLLRFRDEDSLEFWREWMDRHSGGKIRFPKSFSALLPMIEAFST
ncbi:MAG TPA: hypothetical protein VG273_20720 [Bryobacteraceae bacterium]|jgi:hypothetical protein|nr:hypothetical protein [Bryobacteraceae bacterium]